VVANKEGDQPTYIFRSYPHDGAKGEIKNPGPADDHPIWEVARATSAAPTFFDPIDIDGVLYSDGGVGSNNPVLLLIDEVISKSGLTGAGALVGAFDVLISVGTGQKPSKKLKAKHKHPSVSSWVSRRTLYRQVSSIISGLKHAATDTEEKHLQIKKWSVDAGFNGYYRWTGGEEVGGLGLDEWNKEGKGSKPPTAKFIEQKVKIYMARDDIKNDVREAAQKLVDRRRARIADPSRNKYGKKYRGRFGRYSYCTLLRCPWCKHPKKTFAETEDALVEHVSSEHKDIKGDLYSRVGEFPHVPPRNPGGPH
jgi:Patatin-like phospholipase